MVRPSRFPWTFFSIDREFEGMSWQYVRETQRKISALNRKLRRVGLPPVDDGDYGSFYGLLYNSSWAGLLHYHRLLHTLCTCTDFEEICAQELPGMRERLLQHRGSAPVRSARDFFLFVVIPSIVGRTLAK